MNYKKPFVVCLVFIAIFLLSAYNNETTPIKQQLLDEMENINMDVDEILHMEVVNDGILIFYSNDNQLNNGFIKSNKGKWEWYFGGGSMPFHADEGFNWAGTNFDDFFVQYGIKTDNEIKQIKQEKSNRYAKIIQMDDGITIYLFINEPAGYEKVRPVYE